MNLALTREFVTGCLLVIKEVDRKQSCITITRCKVAKGLFVAKEAMKHRIAKVAEKMHMIDDPLALS